MNDSPVQSHIANEEAASAAAAGETESSAEESTEPSQASSSSSTPSRSESKKRPRSPLSYNQFRYAQRQKKLNPDDSIATMLEEKRAELAKAELDGDQVTITYTSDVINKALKAQEKMRAEREKQDKKKKAKEAKEAKKKK